jgi:hypothetical protein
VTSALLSPVQARGQALRLLDAAGFPAGELSDVLLERATAAVRLVADAAAQGEEYAAADAIIAATEAAGEWLDGDPDPVAWLELAEHQATLVAHFARENRR